MKSVLTQIIKLYYINGIILVSKKRVTLIALFGAVLAVSLCVAFQLTNSKARQLKMTASFITVWYQ